MNLVDSSGWLEYFSGSKNANHFAPVLEDIPNLLVSTINIYEVYKKVLSKSDENNAIYVMGVMQQARVIDVDLSIAIEAAKLSAQYEIPMADSIIYATSQMYNALLWTQDSDFIGLDAVKYFQKTR